MKKLRGIILGSLVLITGIGRAQSPIDSIAFFADEKPLDLTLTTDLKKIKAETGLDVYQPATVVLRMTDNTTITEDIRVCARGHVRREVCQIPPLMLNFHNTSSPLLNPLGKLKLVIGCGVSGDDEQLLLKEFLIYKMYNMLEGKSFRVRLVKVSYVDSKNKMKAFSQYAFFLEDDDDLVARIGCVKKVTALASSESTDRTTMTMVALFQYMIGNTDWSVPNYHNIKVVYDKKESNLAFAVPYDFDNAGLVNASYAVPSPVIGTETVTERVYRGYGRTMDELEATLDIYRQNKAKIYGMIKDSALLKDKTKREMTDYLDDFFKMIENKGKVQETFIKGARH